MSDDGKGPGTDPTLIAETPSGDPTIDARAAGADRPRVPPVSREPSPGGSSDYGDFVEVDPAHYSLGAELARGGMGRIVTARDRRLGRRVAIKQLLYDDADALTRFDREARITARLEHPSIVAVHEAGRWPSGEPFYAMKLIAGRPLDKCIADADTLADRLALLGNVTAAVNALAYAHSQRVIHRDLKPANVLVGDYGETVVIDWGLAKDLATHEPGEHASLRRRTDGGGAETIAGAVIGTPSYMPPEQADGEAVDERADVYALGALLYHMLAGVPPYLARTVHDVLALVQAGPPAALATLVPEAPADLIAIVDKAMARDPAERFPTASEMATELERFQMGQLVASHRYTRSEWTSQVTQLGDKRVVETTLGAADQVVELARSRAGRRIATLDEAKHAVIWDLDANRERTLPIDNVEHVAISADGKQVVTVRFDPPTSLADRRTVERWPVSGGPAVPVTTFPQPVTALAVSPDGSRIAMSWVAGGEVVLVTNDGAPETLGGGTNILHALAFSPDGNLLAAGGEHWEITVWNLDTRAARELVGHSGTVAALVFSPDSSQLASTAGDKTVRVWRLGASTPPKILRGHTGIVRSIEWSDDGEYLLTGSEDRTARLWDVVSDQSRPFGGHEVGVLFAGFSADRKRLIVVDRLAVVAIHHDDLPLDELALRAWLDTVAREAR